ncbi:MAG: hypothetical protein CBC03_12320 [Pseudoalteromonas sp. TMED43]|nr:MAG: hypothetical protein CBC03_12320 [Pseudoalteromonas sp. TMED43]
MPNPNNAVSTELDAVNQILSSVGQAPVTTLDMQNPEVYTVVETLRNTSREVQSEGWGFNSEYHVKFTPKANKQIDIPYDVLEIDTDKNVHGDTYNVIRKEGKLYDKYHHRFSDREEFEFDEDIYCDVIYFRQFNDLPFAFQAHITAKAARKVAIKLIGSGELIQILAADEELTKAAIMQYETRQSDYSIFGWRDNQNYYNSYQPYNALAR